MPKSPEIIPQQKLAARKLHVSATALRQWGKEPTFPSHPDGYNINAIREWLKQRGSPKAESPAKQEIELRRLRHKERREKALADRAEREEQERLGNILARDEQTLSLREIIGLARDRLVSEIPREIAKRFPSLRKKIFEISGRVTGNVLKQLARDCEQLSQDAKR